MRPPEWRDEAAAGLVVRLLERKGIGEGPVLVVEDPLEVLDRLLEGRGTSVVRWNRRALGGRPAAPWPGTEPVETALVRLSRSREETEMALHAALSVLRVGGRLLLYGARDEGIVPWARRLTELLGGVETAAVGRRCRVLQALRPEEVPGLRGSLEAWRRTGPPPVDGVEGSWTSYPGVFGDRGLDAGTRLLLEVLPPVPEGAAVLDFGCGSGVVGAVAASRAGGPVELDLLDVDAVALEAARENVPGGRCLLGDGMDAVDGGPYHLVLSNPPIHRGKAETLAVVEDLVWGARARLRPGGLLLLVAQRRLPVEHLVRRAGGRARIRADRGGFRVWEVRWR